MNVKMDGITYDNNVGDISNIFNNYNESYKDQLLNISGRKIDDLSSEESLLIYTKKEKDDVESSCIFHITSDNRLITNNIAGFIGTENTTLSIKSRFAKKDNNDYFLHYMLQKVFNINLTSLEHNTDMDSVFSFMPYLFKHFFINALTQGVYKKYVWNKYNDSRVKGSIDIARHIKYNFMNNGRIAYNLREHSYDNNITQLIRHTIEYIKNNSMYSFILEDEEIQPFIKDILYATASYSQNSRQNIINQNIKSHIHPYYYQYEPLRKICLQILMQDDLKYGKDESKIYGVLFDTAWLWEEYLAVLLQQVKGAEHTHNKQNNGSINMLEEEWQAFPDYYIKDYVVMDAKYKHMNKLADIDRNDRNQILAYMYILGVKNGIFIYPDENNSYDDSKPLNDKYNNNLKDHQHQVHKYAFRIPQGSIKNMQDFKEKIIEEEKKFIEYIKGFMKHKENIKQAVNQ